MIPNSAPMAAVYLNDRKTLSSRPVVAWDEEETEALAPTDWGTVMPVEYAVKGAKLLGLWYGSWTPSCEEMASLLPDYTPGTRHPLTVDVEIRETPSHRWAAVRLSDQKTEVDAADVGTLKERLSVLGHFHVTRIVGLGEY